MVEWKQAGKPERESVMVMSAYQIFVLATVGVFLWALHVVATGVAFAGLVGVQRKLDDATLGGAEKNVPLETFFSD